jgi:hypothetical protein
MYNLKLSGTTADPAIVKNCLCQSEVITRAGGSRDLEMLIDRRGLKREEIVYIARATRHYRSNWRFVRRFIENTLRTTTWMSFLS